MTSIILFRYHREFDVCIQTLRQLKRLNPAIAIHGMFGGAADAVIPPALLDMLASNWIVPSDDYFYKWRNGDLCARLWFKAFGRNLDFDHAYFLEWDMLFVHSLDAVYGKLQHGANYTTIFGDYAHARSIGWWWIDGHYGMETSRLLGEIAWRGEPVDLTALQFGYMCGAVFCRDFLERYAAETVPSYSNDELRFSVYSRSFGIPLLDNNIRRRAATSGNYFLTEECLLTRENFEDFMSLNGDVMHPFRIVIDNIDDMIGSQLAPSGLEPASAS